MEKKQVGNGRLKDRKRRLIILLNGFGIKVNGCGSRGSVGTVGSLQWGGWSVCRGLGCNHCILCLQGLRTPCRGWSEDVVFTFVDRFSCRF